MNPNTKQRTPPSFIGAVSSAVSAAPSSMYFSRPTMKRWEDAINQRIGFVTPERLMNAAKHKQWYEVNVEHADFSPDLWSPENAQLLNDVAIDILQHSKQGETIQMMADKVVIMCALLRDPKSAELDKTQLMHAMDNVYMHNQGDSIEMLLQRIRNRVYMLKEQMQRRKLMLERKLQQQSTGGFHKKTRCRRSIKMSKSRKSRSRR